MTWWATVAVMFTVRDLLRLEVFQARTRWLGFDPEASYPVGLQHRFARIDAILDPPCRTPSSGSPSKLSAVTRAGRPPGR